GELLRGAGQILALVSPQFAEVDYWKLGRASLVVFLRDFDVRQLRVVRVERRQEGHSADLMPMLPDPISELYYLILSVRDCTTRVVISPIEFVVQPVVTLFDC